MNSETVENGPEQARTSILIPSGLALATPFFTYLLLGAALAPGGEALLALAAVVLMFGTIAVLRSLFEFMRERRALPLVLVMLWAVAWYGLAGAAGNHVLRRAQCCAWALVPGDFLRQYFLLAYAAVDQGEPLPESASLWIAQGSLSDRVFRTPRCSTWRLRDVRIGPYSVQDYRDGRVSIDQLRTAALCAPPGAWEAVGPFVLCRDEASILSGRALIIGFSAADGDPSHTHWHILFADNSVSMFHTGSSRLAEAVERDARLRAELGLPPTPPVGPIGEALRIGADDERPPAASR